MLYSKLLFALVGSFAALAAADITTGQAELDNRPHDVRRDGPGNHPPKGGPPPKNHGGPGPGGPPPKNHGGPPRGGPPPPPPGPGPIVVVGGPGPCSYGGCGGGCMENCAREMSGRSQACARRDWTACANTVLNQGIPVRACQVCQNEVRRLARGR